MLLILISDITNKTQVSDEKISKMKAKERNQINNHLYLKGNTNITQTNLNSLNFDLNISTG